MGGAAPVVLQGGPCAGGLASRCLYCGCFGIGGALAIAGLVLRACLWLLSCGPLRALFCCEGCMQNVADADIAGELDLLASRARGCCGELRVLCGCCGGGGAVPDEDEADEDGRGAARHRQRRGPIGARPAKANPASCCHRCMACCGVCGACAWLCSCCYHAAQCCAPAQREATAGWGQEEGQKWAKRRALYRRAGNAVAEAAARKEREDRRETLWKRVQDLSKDAYEQLELYAGSVWSTVRGASAVLPVRFAAGNKATRTGRGNMRHWALDENDYRTDAAQRRADACLLVLVDSGAAVVELLASVILCPCNLLGCSVTPCGRVNEYSRIVDPAVRAAAARGAGGLAARVLAVTARGVDAGPCDALVDAAGNLIDLLLCSPLNCSLACCGHLAGQSGPGPQACFAGRRTGMILGEMRASCVGLQTSFALGLGASHQLGRGCCCGVFSGVLPRAPRSALAMAGGRGEDRARGSSDSSEEEAQAALGLADSDDEDDFEPGGTCGKGLVAVRRGGCASLCCAAESPA